MTEIHARTAVVPGGAVRKTCRGASVDPVMSACDDVDAFDRQAEGDVGASG